VTVGAPPGHRIKATGTKEKRDLLAHVHDLVAVAHKRGHRTTESIDDRDGQGMTTRRPSSGRSDPDAERMSESPDVLVEQVPRRRRRRGVTGSALIATLAIAVALILGMAGGGGDGVGYTAHGQSSLPGSRASSRVRASIATHRIDAAALTVSLPVGWHWEIERGNYRNCTRPVDRLDLASYRLPVGFGKHEGPTVVPPNGILLELTSAPVRSRARPWRGWRLSNRELRHARNVGPNHYAAEVDLPSSPADTASAWFGSIPASRSVLAAANRILRTVRINQAYGCQ
jgi:hypothetical protein